MQYSGGKILQVEDRILIMNCNFVEGVVVLTRLLLPRCLFRTTCIGVSIPGHTRALPW